MAVLLTIITCLLFKAWSEDKINNLTADEIVESGHSYLIFGSQSTSGIELYDLKQKKFINFIIPTSKDTIYKDVVVGISGKGYCIGLTDIFNNDSRKIELISFDLNLQNKHSAENLPIKKYATLSLSPDENKLAIVYASSLDSPYVIGIYNVATRNIETTFPVDSRYETPLSIAWKSDNKTIAIWSTLINGQPAVEIDTTTGQSHSIGNFPIEYKGNYMILMDSKKESVYSQDLSSGEKHTIVEKNATGHSFSVSKDGKYVVFGWLRGLGGAETITVMEIKSRRRLQIKTTHTGTVLGLALW